MFLQKAVGGGRVGGGSGNNAIWKMSTWKKDLEKACFEIYMSQGTAMGTWRMTKLKILKWQQLSFSLTQRPLEHFHFASFLSDALDLSTSLFLSNWGLQQFSFSSIIVSNLLGYVFMFKYRYFHLIPSHIFYFLSTLYPFISLSWCSLESKVNGIMSHKMG